MKHLVIARHGEYDPSSKRLNDDGRLQLLTLAEELEPILNGGLIGGISSISPRALDSSGVLSEALGIPKFEGIFYLGSDSPAHLLHTYEILRDTRKVMELINEREGNFDSLIVMSHQELVGDLPPYFAQEELGIEYKPTIVTKGRAVHFDLEGRTYQVLPKFAF